MGYSREILYTCEMTGCGKKIYDGDPFCSFYDEVKFCPDHAVKLSDYISVIAEALDDEEYVFFPESSHDELRERLAKAQDELAADGDRSVAMVNTALDSKGE